MTNDKTPKRKKSETLEVRLPYDTKQAFLTACREDGTTASEVVRTSIDTYLEERERPDPQTQTGNVIAMIPKPLRSRKVAAGLAGAAGLALLSVLPSAADPDIKSAFSRLDKNKDNVISLDEFMPPHDDKKTDREVNIVTARRSVSGDRAAPLPAPAAGAERKEDAYTFWLPDEEGGQDVVEQRFVSHRSEVRIVKRDGDAGATPDIEALKSESFSFDGLRKKEFSQFDADGDGKIILSEYEARQRAMLTRGFEILDADRSGSLSQAEYLRIAHPPVLAPDAAATVGGSISFVAGVSRVPEEKLKAYFVKLDRNRDGRLSLQEYLPPT